MAITIAGILCEEVVADFSEGYDLIDGPTANKSLICNWADRFTVAQGILGLNTTVTIGGFITIHVPMRYPEIPYMYAYQIAIRGIGPPYQGATQMAFPYAMIMVNYKCTPWSFSGIDDQFNQIDPTQTMIYAEQNIRSSSEYLEIPNRATKFEATGNLNPNSLLYKIALVDFVITFHQQPYLLTSQILNLSGSINDQQFLGVTKGSLRFDGVDTHRTHSTTGQSTTDITLMFQARSIRWDYGWNSKSQSFERLVKPDGSALIPITDLSVVLPGAFRY